MRKLPEGLLAHLLDSLADIFCLVLDQDYRVIYANAAFLEHFGLGWPEIVGRSCLELMSPFTGPEAQQMGFCPADSGPVYPDHTLLTREEGGEKFFYEATFYPFVDGAAAGARMVGVFRDVTEKLRLKSQVRQLFELERKLVQTSMDGIIVNDPKGNVLIFNKGAAKILGYDPVEVVGKINASELYPPGVAHEIKEKIYSPEYSGPGRLENYETVGRHQSGALIPIWLSAQVLTEDGKEIGVVGYFRDLRERKQLEEELLRHERLASLGTMVAHVTHEIKNPLATIGGFVQLMQRHEGLSEDDRRRLRLIHEEVQRLEKFLADLGTFGRISPVAKAPGDLAPLIREVGDLMDAAFKEHGVAFILEAPPQVPRLLFDPGQMRQVFLNLFKNALEAMPRGGRLTVSVRVESEHLRLAVADTGPGIPPEHLKRLFTPFFSTKEKGTGLGLTICRGLIEQHQGEIEIESEVGRGTTCIIRLPLQPPK